MRPRAFEQALAAMDSMQAGEEYGLAPADSKRGLAMEIARICREENLRPVVIGGLAVNHHGYLRVTADVDLLLSRPDAARLSARLRRELGWKRYAEGFKNTVLGVGLDFCVEGDRTSPEWAETYPSPSAIRTVPAEPLPVAALSELLALKAMSGRARDDADVVELLKRHRAKARSLLAAARKRLRTAPARARLATLAKRAREENRR
ncbi:MAG: hypothetical protein AAB215_00060 [Planctomycetota bacterium]